MAFSFVWLKILVLRSSSVHFVFVYSGRVDLVECLDHATKLQAKVLFEKFYPLATEVSVDETIELESEDMELLDEDVYKVKVVTSTIELSNEFSDIVNALPHKPSMAEIQGYLLQYKTSPENAVKNAHVGLLAMRPSRKADEGGSEVEAPRIRVKGKPVKQLTPAEVDKMMFNPQPGWEEL